MTLDDIKKQLTSIKASLYDLGKKQAAYRMEKSRKGPNDFIKKNQNDLKKQRKALKEEMKLLLNELKKIDKSCADQWAKDLNIS